ncbi:MAG: hypothetical protein AAGG75_08385 [Bacteroidota bacterium]
MNFVKQLIMRFPIPIVTIFCLCVGLLWGPTAHAQDNYHQSAGIRGGTTVGVSYKEFIDVPTAIEGIVGFNFENGRLFTLTGLYQYHIFLNYQLNVFGGAGLSTAFNENKFRLLGEVMIGFEYTVPRFPLNFSIDYKPNFSAFELEPFLNEFGVSIRYIID